MIKVAYDSQIFAQQQFGGVSRYFCELARHVANTSGFDAQVIAPLHRNLHLTNSSVLSQGIYYNPVWRGTGKMMRSINHLLTPLLLKSYKPDVLHETYYQQGSYSNRDCARVITVFDMINEKFSSDPLRRDKETRAKRAAVSRADAVICISEHTRRDLIELLDVAEAKTHVVYLGFTLACESEIDCTKNIAKPFILYVGKRDGYKNFNTLLDAFASSSRLREEFTLVAFGGGALSPEERRRIATVGLNSDEVVHFAGNDDVLRALYRRAHCFVYPSMYEGFGIPPLEAMSFGCPVVCSNASSLPEVVGDAAITVDPLSVEAVREAVEIATFDESVRRDLISKGMSQIKKFSWEACAEHTINIYRNLL